MGLKRLPRYLWAAADWDEGKEAFKGSVLWQGPNAARERMIRERIELDKREDGMLRMVEKKTELVDYAKRTVSGYEDWDEWDSEHLHLTEEVENQEKCSRSELDGPWKHAGTQWGYLQR